MQRCKNLARSSPPNFAAAIKRSKSNHELREAAKLAGLFQLVTPVSGAVVLETQQQYAQTGLTPVETQTVPSIPEPGIGALLVLGLGLIVAHRRKANARRTATESQFAP